MIKSEREFAEDRCKNIYSHRYYFDVDPARVIVDGEERDFTGKYYATSRIIGDSRALNLAVGDSASDLPMFEAVLESGGEAFWVANARHPEGWDRGVLLTRSFTAGVNELLELVRVRD